MSNICPQQEKTRNWKFCYSNKESFIEFLDEVYVYDEKRKKKKDSTHNAAVGLQHNLPNGDEFFKDLPKAILSGNIDYSDKLIQWILPPRLILFGGIIVMGSIMQIVDWPLALKWWVLFFIMGITLCLAIPDKLVDEQFKNRSENYHYYLS